VPAGVPSAHGWGRRETERGSTDEGRPNRDQIRQLGFFDDKNRRSHKCNLIAIQPAGQLAIRLTRGHALPPRVDSHAARLTPRPRSKKGTDRIASPPGAKPRSASDETGPVPDRRSSRCRTRASRACARPAALSSSLALARLSRNRKARPEHLIERDPTLVGANELRLGIEMPKHTLEPCSFGW